MHPAAPLLLTPAEIRDLTGHRRCDAQARAMDHIAVDRKPNQINGLAHTPILQQYVQNRAAGRMNAKFLADSV